MSQRNNNQKTDPSQRRELTTIQMSKEFSGPIPPPETLAHYNTVLPGAAERILAMAEKQQTHRQDLERRVIFSNTRSQTRGTYLGFAIALTAILSGVFLIYIGREVTGIASIIGALAALVGVFVYGKQAQKKDLSEKKPPS
jgi:uncharacterized membrane protein